MIGMGGSKPFWEQLQDIKPFWEKSPETIVKEVTHTPALTPVGAVVTSIPKIVIPALAFGGGILAGRLFGGGSQTVQPEQTTTVTPELTAKQTSEQTFKQHVRDILSRLNASAESKAEVTPTITSEVTPTTRTSYDISAGGNVDIGGVTTVTTTPTTTTTNTITHAGVSQEVVGQLIAAVQAPKQEPQQITVVTPTQETTATQKTDLGWMVIAAAGVIAAAVLFKGKK